MKNRALLSLICAALLLSGCGKVNDSNKVTKVTTTTTAVTTTVSSTSTSVPVTTSVTMPKPSLITSNTTTTTTTTTKATTTKKTTQKTTTTKTTTATQNGGGNVIVYQDEIVYYDDQGGDNGGQNNDNNYNYDPAPVVTTTTTAAPAPEVQPSPAPVGSVSIDTSDLDDTLKAYLRYGRGDNLSSYDWELIRQDLCNYVIDTYNGKQHFEFPHGSFGTYVADFSAPLQLSVNESWTDFSHAHLNVGDQVNQYGFYQYDILECTSNSELYDLAIYIRDISRAMGDHAIEIYHIIASYDNTVATLPEESIWQFNYGLMPNGEVWFLTE